MSNISPEGAFRGPELARVQGRRRRTRASESCFIQSELGSLETLDSLTGSYQYYTFLNGDFVCMKINFILVVTNCYMSNLKSQFIDFEVEIIE